MNNNPSNKRQLTFGLDIGIASVGWAVLDRERIVDLGVRAFNKAETADRGESLNLVRRTAKLTRRRIHRKAHRLEKLGNLLHQQQLIPAADFFKNQPHFNDSPWQLRVEGLDRRLQAIEWARVIYHICKHRGFHWVSRADRIKEGSDASSEGGKVKQGLAENSRLMEEKEYRTVAEMVLKEYPHAQRNKRGDYSKALSRISLSEELNLLFERQAQLRNPNATETLKHAILGSGDQKSGLLWEQRPPLSGENLLKMVGRCTFEKEEYRAPKESFSAERHAWLTQLNNIRILIDGAVRPLNSAERAFALPLPYQRKGNFTYKNLRTALVKEGLLEDDFNFTCFSYAPGKDGKVKDPEAAVLIKLPGWQTLRKTLEDAGLQQYWKEITQQALEAGVSTLLDQIAWVLTVYKEDEEAQQALEKLGLPQQREMIDALLNIRFDQFSNLSLKALSGILPEMEKGLRYDQACAEAGYHHSLQPQERAHYLPPLYSGRDPEKNTMVWNEELDLPRNPVVLRAINQSRKVINALVREYGSPYAVHIEMARDLSRPLKERKQIEKAQGEYRKRNEQNREEFESQFGYAPSGRELEKFQLYREQHGKCAYSLKPLDLDRVIHGEKYVEVDHVLPYSRSYDNSKNNKVLVLTVENQHKGNRTPYEYLSGAEESERWLRFRGYVEGNKSWRQAKRNRLLRKQFGGEEARGFRERNLNDTRYICRFFKNYVEHYLQLADGSENRRCVVLSGQLTAFLRARWGLLKVRGESDRHHALDAVVTAACSHGMVKRLADYSRRRELTYAQEQVVDPETGEILDMEMLDQLEQHFPQPWSHFRDEVRARLQIDDPQQLREMLADYGTYSEHDLQTVRPLFVSRAPQRRSGGAAHKETIYAQPEWLKKQGGVTQKVPLSSLTLKDLDQLVDPHRNQRLYQAIRKRLEEFGGKGEKAFSADNPFYKPDKKGKPTGPVVRTVTKVIDKQSGIPVRGGVAKNDTMLRVDLFTKGGKFYLIPIYVHHRVEGLPNRAIVASKDEEEWTEVDQSFEFLYSLYPNDYVVIQRKKDVVEGYYASCHRRTGNINLWSQDRNRNIGKNGAIEGVGVKTALSIQKCHVDMLGRRYLAEPEVRQPLR